MKPYTSTVKPVQHIVHNNCSSELPLEKTLQKLSGAILRHQSNLSINQIKPSKNSDCDPPNLNGWFWLWFLGGRDYMVTTLYKNQKNRLSPVNPNRRTSLDLLSWDDCRSDSPWHLAPGHNAPPPSPAFERFFVGYVRHTDKGKTTHNICMCHRWIK